MDLAPTMHLSTHRLAHYYVTDQVYTPKEAAPKARPRQPFQTADQNNLGSIAKNLPSKVPSDADSSPSALALAANALMKRLGFNQTEAASNGDSAGAALYGADSSDGDGSFDLRSSNTNSTEPKGAASGSNDDNQLFVQSGRPSMQADEIGLIINFLA